MQHRPDGSSAVRQHTPMASTATPPPPHTPQASTVPVLQQRPCPSTLLPSGQHFPVVESMYQSQQRPSRSTMPPMHAPPPAAGRRGTSHPSPAHATSQTHRRVVVLHTVTHPVAAPTVILGAAVAGGGHGAHHGVQGFRGRHHGARHHARAVRQAGPARTTALHHPCGHTSTTLTGLGRGCSDVAASPLPHRPVREDVKAREPVAGHGGGWGPWHLAHAMQ